MVKFEKFYVVAAHWEATLSTVFAGKILRQTTRTSARNNTVSETGEILMYVLHYDNRYLSSEPFLILLELSQNLTKSFLSSVYFIELILSLSSANKFVFLFLSVTNTI